MVAFRVRAEEYEALKRAVLGEGSGSVSEFARLAIFHRASYLGQIRSRLGAIAQELQGHGEGLVVLLRAELLAQERLGLLVQQ